MTERAHQRNWNGDGSLKYFQQSGAAGWNWFTRGREEGSSGNLPLPRTHEPCQVQGKAVGTDLHPGPCHDTTEPPYININRAKATKVTTKGRHCFVEQQEKILPGALKR